MKLRAAAASDRHACTHSGMCCHAVKYSYRVLHAPASCAQIRAHDAESIFFRAGKPVPGKSRSARQPPSAFFLRKSAQRNDLMFPALSFLTRRTKTDARPSFPPGSFIPNLIHHIERVSTVCENRLIQAHGILDGVEGIDNILPEMPTSEATSVMDGSFWFFFKSISRA